jgi:hypothetical protein
MAEETNPMEIDVIAAGNPSYGGRASLWVEKYRPQSLDDVAAHRDIVDTSNSLSLSLSLSLTFSFTSRVYRWCLIHCLLISVCS